MKHLIFFTSQFPFGHAETFIENELSFLAGAFDRIFIVTNNISDNASRPVPEKIKIIRVSSAVPLRYKLSAAAHFFTPVIQKEKNFIKRLKLPLNRPVISAMLGGYAQAIYTADLIGDIMAQNDLLAASTVLYSYWMSNIAAGIALYKLKNPEVKAVCRAHGWDVYFERHTPPYLPLRGFILSALDYCCCISENGKEYFEKLFPGQTKNNILVSRLGTFNKTGKVSYGNTGKLVLVSCSNIIPLKRIHLIIEAIASIENIQIDWTHFGSGSLEQEIRAAAKQKLSSRANISFRFAGQINNAVLLDYYASNNIDLFINLSETEGLPVSFMEAGSFGIPVIATNVGGVSEIIKDGINGLVVEANTPPNKIADKIKAVLCFT